MGIATPYNAALDNTLHSQRLRFIWVQVEDEIEQAKQAINAVVKSTRLNSNTIRSKKCRESCATVLHARDRKQHLLHIDGKAFWIAQSTLIPPIVLPLAQDWATALLTLVATSKLSDRLQPRLA